MKKIVLGIFLILALLLFYTAVFVNFATANPIWGATVPQAPVTTPPTINVSTPAYNETYLSPKVTLSFTINEPEEWFEFNTSAGTVPSGTIPYFDNIIVGNITSVYYELNGERQNLSVPNIPAFSPTNGSMPTYLSYSIPLNLTTGRYSIQIYVEANSFYMPNIFTGTTSSVVVNAVSEPINFAVAFPQPFIVTPASIVYNDTSIPLTFSLDTPANWIGYSLDGKSNVTITGNTTLTGLTNGEHYVTVYTNDTLGNAYASQTTNFTIALPTTKSAPYTMVAIIAVSGVTAVMIAVWITYLKRREGQNQGSSEGQTK